MSADHQYGGIKTERQLRAELDRLQRRQRQGGEEDVVIQAPRRLFIASPTGAIFQVDVDSDGNLTITDEAGAVRVLTPSTGGTSDLDAPVLGGYSKTDHRHVIADVAELADRLLSKADVKHSHALLDLPDVAAALDSKAAVKHLHELIDIVGLGTALARKADDDHRHTIADTSGLQSALNGKLDDTQASAFGLSLLATATLAAAKTLLALVKGDVGLGNVDNTSDANKPVSSAQQAALNLKADLASAIFSAMLRHSGSQAARFENAPTAAPTGATGLGVEVLGVLGGFGIIQAFNRTTAAYGPLGLDGSTVSLRPGGTTVLTAAGTGIDVLGETRTDTLRLDAAETIAAVASDRWVPVNINGTVRKLLIAP